MPRRKIARPDIDLPDGSELPALTDQQAHFVERILAGDTASDAYRVAYDCANSQPRTIWARASELRNDSGVAAWLSAARKACLGAATVTLEGHLREMERLREIAVDTGNVGAAVQAEVFRGRASGHYVEQWRDVTPKDPMDTLREIARVSPAMAEQLANAMGLKWLEHSMTEKLSQEKLGAEQTA